MGERSTSFTLPPSTENIFPTPQNYLYYTVTHTHVHIKHRILSIILIPSSALSLICSPPLRFPVLFFFNPSRNRGLRCRVKKNRGLWPCRWIIKGTVLLSDFFFANFVELICVQLIESDSMLFVCFLNCVLWYSV